MVTKSTCCPRCQGSLELLRDSYGWYARCLMCGQHFEGQIREGAARLTSMVLNDVVNHETGCHIHPDCLTCPLDRCIHDDPFQFHRDRWLNRDQERYQALQAYIEQGLNLSQAAKAMEESGGIGIRSVFRLKARVEGRKEA